MTVVFSTQLTIVNLYDRYSICSHILSLFLPFISFFLELSIFWTTGTRLTVCARRADYATIFSIGLLTFSLMHCPIATHADFSQQDWDWLWRNAENDVPVELKHSVVMTYSNPNGERKNKYTLQAARCEKAAHRQKAECLPPTPNARLELGQFHHNHGTSAVVAN